MLNVSLNFVLGNLARELVHDLGTHGSMDFLWLAGLLLHQDSLHDVVRNGGASVLHVDLLTVLLLVGVRHLRLLPTSLLVVEHSLISLLVVCLNRRSLLSGRSLRLLTCSRQSCLILLVELKVSLVLSVFGQGGLHVHQGLRSRRPGDVDAWFVVAWAWGFVVLVASFFPDCE